MDKEEEVGGDHDGGDGQGGDEDGDDHRCLWYALNKDTSDTSESVQILNIKINTICWHNI